MTLLEGAADEYLKENHEARNTAYPIAPNSERSLDEKMSGREFAKLVLGSPAKEEKKTEVIASGGDGSNPILHPETTEGSAAGGDHGELKTKTEVIAGKKPWSEKYDRCQDCGSDEKRHLGRGFCSSCYFKVKNKPASKRTYVSSEKKKAGRILEDTVEKNWPRAETLPASQVYCQYANCPNKGRGFDKGTMLKKDDLYFCSEECRQDFTLLNYTIPEDEQSFSSGLAVNAPRVKAY